MTGVEILALTVRGRPEPKGRPRFRRQRDLVVTYTPKKTADWERTVCDQVAAQLHGHRDGLPLAGRTLATLGFRLRRPSSTPKRVRWPLRKPDPDNLAKAVLDALVTARVLASDSQVTDLLVSKRFADDDHPEGCDIDLTVYTVQ